MKTRIIGFILALAAMTIVIASNAQDKVFGAFFDDQEIKSININSSTGSVSGSWGNDLNIQQTAALGYGVFGNVHWLISLQYTSDDKVDIYAYKASGIGSNIKIKNDADIANGSDDLDYVRLGIDKNGIGWIVSKESDGNDIYVASFTWDGNTNHDPVISKRGKLNTSNNTNSIFRNGDLAVAGDGVMYVLANNGSGTTKIYNINTAVLLSSGSNSTNTLSYRWDVKNHDGSSFSGSVNGFAFASTGSAYVSTSGGLYYLDQYTTNFSGSGTVKCTLSKSTSDLADLATSYWPMKTDLPVRIVDIRVKLTYEEYQVIK